MYQWLQEVEKRQDELFQDLFRLLKIPSVREDDLATEDAPVGPGPKAALEEFMKMAQEDGFVIKQFGPWAGRIEIGEGDQLLGILGHVDVVPVGSGWDTDPFTPVVKDNRIYARGSSDDKGPTVAAYFALKLLRELGVTFNQKIHLIVGTDEESGWQCMDYYFKHAEMPDYGFSPDAVFPIINGEKGNVSATITIPVSNDTHNTNYHLSKFEAGLRENMVPQDAVAVVVCQANEECVQMAQQFSNYIAEHNLGGETSIDNNVIELSLVGKAAHGSTPDKGINAATFLANFLSQYSFDHEAEVNFIEILATLLHDDPTAKKIGAAIHDDVMGDLTMNVGIVNFNENTGGRIITNFRYPKGTEPMIILDQMTKSLAHLGVVVDMGAHKEPHYVSIDDPMVKTLLDVYHEQTGLPAHEMTIGGGTYGRLMPRGVAYGALFPDSIDTMHQANEFIAIDDLLKATAIYADAIYRLTR